ncbi:hypothetical protein LTS18_009038, partial [Coniosporium uncinatum]
MPQLDDQLALQHFHQFVAQNCEYSVVRRDEDGTNRQFLPHKRLKEYFSDGERVFDILRAVFLHAGQPSGALRRHIQHHFTRIFSILLSIGQGSFIKYFVDFDSLCDEALPFESQPKDFPSVDFFPAFYKQQWTFCAPTIRHSPYRKFHEDE